jgi:hypothetical protein
VIGPDPIRRLSAWKGNYESKTIKPIENRITMKTFTLVAATFLALALSIPQVNAEGVPSRKPFNGTWEANEVSNLFGNPPIGFFSNGQGTLSSTQLGSLALYFSVLVDLGSLDGVGRARLMDTNGDSIFTYVSGHADPLTPEPPVFHITETHIVTGGTGRYAHARGSFNVDRTIDNSTGDSSGTFYGAIVVPRQP